MNDIQLDWLTAVPVLLAAARTGSATQAAAALGVSPATALRRIEAAEVALGVRLFDRTPGGLLPTLGLERALPWAEQIEAAAFGLSRDLRGLESAPTGTVRFALLPSASAWFIAPALGRLRARHPDLVVELLTGSTVVDLVRREADLAMRVVRPTHPDLVSRPLGTARLAVVAAPALIDTLQPCTLADLPWLCWDASVDAAEQRWLDAVVPNARVVLRASDLETLLRAAVAGVGVMVTTEALATRIGGLARVPVTTPPMPQSTIYLVAHRALRPVPRIAAVWAWLIDEFELLERDGALRLDNAPTPSAGAVRP